MDHPKTDSTGVVLACPACGQKNRTPFDHLSQSGQCGKCKAPLGPPVMPVDVSSSQDFQNLIAQSALPVLVDFWAPWCSPCRRVAPEMEKVAASEAGTLLVAKVNTQDLPDLGQRFAVQAIPTMAVFWRGAELGRQMGAMPASAIVQFARSKMPAAGAA